MHKIKMYALLVGVDDYQTYNSSGRMDLPGSVNDAFAWRDTLLRRGFAPQNIRMLLSPSPHAGGPPVLLPPDAEPATRANIERGVQWLAEQLSADEEYAEGIFTFSGHGDVGGEAGGGEDDEGVPRVCPTDTEADGGKLKNTLTVEELIEGLPRNATVVLDCCHSGKGEARILRSAGYNSATGEELPGAPEFTPGGAVVLSLRGRPASSVRRELFRMKRPAARVFTASSVAGTAFQAEMAGRFHGALTWALTSLLGQWKSTPRLPPSVTLSCFSAREYAERLITVLALPQTPTLYGPWEPTAEDAHNVPFLGVGVREDETISDVPDGPRVPIEFPPDLLVWLGTEASPADPYKSGVISALGHEPPHGFERNKEYWRLGERVLDYLTNSRGPLTFEVDSVQPPPWDAITPSPGYSLFSMELTPNWADASAPTGKGYYTNDGEAPAAVFFALVPPSSSTDRWTGTITWYRVLQDGADPMAPVFGPRGRRFYVNDGPINVPATAPMHWQRVVLSPQPVPV